MSKFIKHDSIYDSMGVFRKCLAFTIYAEQVGLEAGSLRCAQVVALNDFLRKLVAFETAEDGYEPAYIVDGIVHDADYEQDPDGKPGDLRLKKPHAHLMLTIIGDHKKRVGTFFQWLSARGCNWRKGIDDIILNAGTDLIDLKRHMDVATFVYLTHETFKKLDTETVYPRDFIYSTRSKASRSRMYDDYIKYFSASTVDPDASPREAEKIALGIRARVAGECNVGFSSWWSSVEDRYKVRPSYKSFCLDYYNEGVESYLSKAPYISRVCVYIYGLADSGKTYGSQHALLDLGYKVRKISRCSGTGKFDRLQPGECVVFDDCYPECLAGFVEDSPVELYKRGSGNPLYTGRFCVVTGNKTPQEFLRLFSGEDYNAIRSRVLFVTVTSDGSLVYDLPSKVRGDLPRIKEKLDAFADFALCLECYTTTYAKARPISMGFDFKAYLDSKGLNASGKSGKVVQAPEHYENSVTGESVDLPMLISLEA